MTDLTPLMKQYFSIKEEYPDAILFFRLGDFYEMFGEDAATASSILQITLTTRDRGKDEPIPMCGVPHFAAETYISRLIKAGHRVAVCEQMEDPKEAKGIVKREVVRVFTPGTYNPESAKENIFIMSIYPAGGIHGISVADLSTGEFLLYETDSPVDDEIQRFEPKEILCPSNLEGHIYYSGIFNGYFTSYYDDFSFDYHEAYKRMLDYYRVYSLGVFGLDGLKAAISSAGALISYLDENRKGSLVLRTPAVMRQNDYMLLDSVSKRNLELTQNMRDGSSSGTLLSVIDETLTPMGGRYIRQSVLRPLIDLNQIKERLDAVDNLVIDFELQETLRTYLRRVHDLERLSTRVLQKTASARDLIAIKNSIKYIPEIKKALSKAASPLLERLAEDIKDFREIRLLIGESITDDPPNSLRDGGIIREGYRQDIDELRNLSIRGKSHITSIEMKERQDTGIGSLKVGYNKVFGYYIEVTKANLHLVPKHYIRKQTLVSAERFITEELKEYESKVLGAEERLKALEYEVFMEILDRISGQIDDLMVTSLALGVLDFLLSLSIVSRRYNYIKPDIDLSGRIEIVDGRHPVLERVPSGEKFIPNSSYMDTEDHRLLIITGPNMAGKSTYMRQVALILLLAQIGSFVPATQARIGIADRIFTRIGASDYLIKGQSTFMVEMIETANILHNATRQSLILLDEVGRGTSTFDGISIAWAVAEYILDRLNARTLFATHYNELTELGITLSGVKNYNVSVKEWGEEIIFLRKIERGPADKSYGIQVARLAGLPDLVINRAKEVLDNLEKSEFISSGTPRTSGHGTKKKTVQLDLFSVNYEPLLNRLQSIDILKISPEEAVKRLQELKRMAEESL